MIIINMSYFFGACNVHAPVCIFINCNAIHHLGE